MSLIILDLDGTISDDHWRRNRVDHSLPDPYKPYNDLMEHDTLINRHLFEDCGHDIAIFTARPENYRMRTMNWLMQHFVPINFLFMRPVYDKSPSPVLKLNFLHLLKEIARRDVVAAYDDREDVVKALASAGIPATLITERRS